MFRQINLTKYTFNQLLFVFSQLNLFLSFWLLWNFEFSLWQYALFVCWNILILHYHLNLVHIASHRILSKNKSLNSILGNLAAIFGGVTFADFSSTHKEHHRFVSDPHKDPDYDITVNTNFFLIPFKIWYHDRFFWQNDLWRQDRSWIGYLVDRVAQVLIVSGFYFSGKLSIWLYFWLLPIYFVGFLNGLFLFYFPHYTTKFENYWRKNPSLITKILVLPIDISRYFHAKHHDRINLNTYYFPVFTYIITKIKQPNYSLQDLRYTDIKS